MKITIEVFFYLLAGFYGFLYSYYLLKLLQKFFFKSVKAGKFTLFMAILFMLVSAVFLFLPALINYRYFIATFLVAVITNLILLIRLSKSFINQARQEEEKEK
jgi:hypothetical protein